MDSNSIQFGQFVSVKNVNGKKIKNIKVERR